MRKLTINEIIKSTGGYSNKQSEALITGISLILGQYVKVIFLYFKGPNFDGHNYIREAFEKGAAASFCERKRNLRLRIWKTKT